MADLSEFHYRLHVGDSVQDDEKTHHSISINEFGLSIATSRTPIPNFETTPGIECRRQLANCIGNHHILVYG